MQNNNALDLGKQLAAAILNLQWFKRKGCSPPTGEELAGKNPPFSSVDAAIEKANGLLAQRRLPGGLCDCCNTGKSCDGTVCGDTDGCNIEKNPLASSKDLTAVMDFLQKWNVYKSCGCVGQAAGSAVSNASLPLHLCTERLHWWLGWGC